MQGRSLLRPKRPDLKRSSDRHGTQCPSFCQFVGRGFNRDISLSQEKGLQPLKPFKPHATKIPHNPPSSSLL
jgi:hypothetical protein